MEPTARKKSAELIMELTKWGTLWIVKALLEGAPERAPTSAQKDGAFTHGLGRALCFLLSL